MGWWFGRKNAPPDVRAFVPAWLKTAGEEEGFARSYSVQFDEVYRRNPVGQRAVRLIAGMLGSLTIDAVEGDERAAALVSADGLLESITANLLLNGNAYVQLIADDKDRPQELCLLRPERVSVVSDEREVVQFGDAIPTGPGRFRLGRLLRGREGTEAAESGHLAGEWFVLIEPDALRVIPLPSWSIGADVSIRETGPNGAPEVRATIGAEASRPLRGSSLVLDGIQVVGTRRPAIPSPAGGATVDSEARTAISELLDALRDHGLIEM